jgi:sarcosine oxidase subunit gamma
MLEAKSALAGAPANGGRDGADGKRRCRLGELRGNVLLQVAGFPATIAEVERVLPMVARRPAPEGTERDRGHWRRPRLPHRPGAVLDRRTCRNGDAEAQLRQVIPHAVGAVTALSHSRTRVVIEGACARDVLRKGIPLDFDPDVFRVDQAALTGLHHTPILVHRAGADRYELYAMRSFALSVWEWLTDAALEYGYDIVAFD